MSMSTKLALKSMQLLTQEQATSKVRKQDANRKKKKKKTTSQCIVNGDVFHKNLAFLIAQERKKDAHQSKGLVDTDLILRHVKRNSRASLSSQQKCEKANTEHYDPDLDFEDTGLFNDDDDDDDDDYDNRKGKKSIKRVTFKRKK
ncbi:uncharacterized protein LOC130649050 [Hydractinia symbiolongicarpus]|uniref:uncharacterized protein LOC130649050 n=1 Tax=Hydractinia symbiolongicarpus TaxID=13093 RepID=UPI00254EEF01|nr:uncharacterized protein LOC130649050 [Hydractinia symbiolongicarpus]